MLTACLLGQSAGGGWWSYLSRNAPNARDAPPNGVQILSFSLSFQEHFDQIIGWYPHLGDWPLLWEILDPPLQFIFCGGGGGGGRDGGEASGGTFV